MIMNNDAIIDNIYNDARKAWKKLNVNMTDLSAEYFKTLKWLLEVTISAPDFNLNLFYNPVAMVKKEQYRYFAVHYKLNKDFELVSLFSNNDVTFYRYESVEMAEKLARAFKKWCELIEQRVFCGARI